MGPTPHSWLKVEEETSAGLLVQREGGKEGGRVSKRESSRAKEGEREKGGTHRRREREHPGDLDCSPRQRPFLKKKEIGHRTWGSSKAPTASSAGCILLYGAECQAGPVLLYNE